jgi:type II secretory pathway pseudopilin PulG
MTVFSPRVLHPGRRAGFTIIEIVISISILLALTVGVVVMLRSAIDVRQGLSTQMRTVRQLNFAMEMVSRDIEHAIVLSSTDQVRMPIERNFKTIFRVEPAGDSDKLSLTTMANKPVVANAMEGDQAYVVYELKDAEGRPGEKDLYRGSANIATANFREDPPSNMILRNVKSFKIVAWRGDDWLRDRWDSTRSDTRNKLPKMVRVELSAFVDTAGTPFGIPADQASATSSAEAGQGMATFDMRTIVVPALSSGMAELKQPVSSIRWY